jgi:hypothetical protein
MGRKGHRCRRSAHSRRPSLRSLRPMAGTWNHRIRRWTEGQSDGPSRPAGSRTRLSDGPGYSCDVPHTNAAGASPLGEVTKIGGLGLAPCSAGYLRIPTGRSRRSTVSCRPRAEPGGFGFSRCGRRCASAPYHQREGELSNRTKPMLKVGICRRPPADRNNGPGSCRWSWSLRRQYIRRRSYMGLAIAVASVLPL